MELTFEDALYCARATVTKTCSECRLIDECDTVCNKVSEMIVECLEKFQKYKELEDKGLLRMRVFKIDHRCLKPLVCVLDCDKCNWGEYLIVEDYINISDYDEKIHYITKDQAEKALANKVKSKGFYRNMPDDFRDAVEIIKQYCQNEDCGETNCANCPHPLSVIRCGDSTKEE